MTRPNKPKAKPRGERKNTLIDTSLKPQFYSFPPNLSTIYSDNRNRGTLERRGDRGDPEAEHQDGQTGRRRTKCIVNTLTHNMIKRDNAEFRLARLFEVPCQNIPVLITS